MKSYKDKVAVITGAASGIGRALAVQLAAEGAHLAISDVNAAALAETAALLSRGGRVTQHVVDVGDRSAVERYADEVRKEHGGADLVINNAGTSVYGSIEKLSYDDFESVIRVDLWGVLYGTKAFLPQLRGKKEGHIVNISSISAMVPLANNGPYNLAKYAVLGFSETLMQELRGSPISVTCVHPGFVRTNIVRNTRNMTDSDAATFDRIAKTTPEQAAQVILRGVRRGKRRIYVGADAKIMALAKRLMPDATVQLMGAISNDPRGR